MKRDNLHVKKLRKLYLMLDQEWRARNHELFLLFPSLQQLTSSFLPFRQKFIILLTLYVDEAYGWWIKNLTSLDERHITIVYVTFTFLKSFVISNKINQQNNVQPNLIGIASVHVIFKFNNVAYSHFFHLLKSVRDKQEQTSSQFQIK